jgi:hypothetical protein
MQTKAIAEPMENRTHGKLGLGVLASNSRHYNRPVVFRKDIHKRYCSRISGSHIPCDIQPCHPQPRSRTMVPAERPGSPMRSIMPTLTPCTTIFCGQVLSAQYFAQISRTPFSATHCLQRF